MYSKSVELINYHVGNLLAHFKRYTKIRINIMSFKKTSNWNKKNELESFLIFKKLEKENFPRGKQIELSRQMAKSTNLSECSISAKVSNYKSVAGINNHSNASNDTKLFYSKYKHLSIEELQQIINEI